MNPFEQALEDYQKIEKVLQFLEVNFKTQPTLSEIAAAAQLSEFHFQKLFSRWVGISPKRFLQFVTKEYAKQLLQESHSLLEVTYNSGLSSPGRLYDLFVSCEAMTPGEFQKKGLGLTIHYGFHPTPFGECMLAVTERGVCGLRFVKESRADVLAGLAAQWPLAVIALSKEKTSPYIPQIFGLEKHQKPVPIHLVVKGTNFQIKVWEALLHIPFGTVVSYHDVARSIGSPDAVRAVGTAIGKNPIPYLIPCHRVIRKMGQFGNYGEGPLRKKALIGWEAAKRQDYESSSAE